MSDSRTAAGGGGVSVGFILFVVFLVLKLTHNINWSWWWVTCPLWGPVAFGVAIVILILAVAIPVAIIKALIGR